MVDVRHRFMVMCGKNGQKIPGKMVSGFIYLKLLLFALDEDGYSFLGFQYFFSPNFQHQIFLACTMCCCKSEFFGQIVKILKQIDIFIVQLFLVM